MQIRYLLFVIFCSIAHLTIAQTNCATPPYNLYVSAVTYQSAQLSWYQCCGNVTGQVQYKATSQTNWTSLPPQSSSTLSLTGLTNNTVYQWRVRAICSVGDTSQVSETRTFQTICASPSSPSTSDVTHQSARLQWQSGVVNAAHEVQWRPVGSSSWTVAGDLSGNATTLQNLPNNTTFEWRVRTRCAENVWSDFTSSVIFRTECAAPQNLSVLAANTNAVELRWSNAPNVYAVDLRWRPVGASTWTEIANLASADYGLQPISPNMYYEWQVRSACSATEKSAYSASSLFQTQCAVPTQLTTLAITHNAAAVSWLASTAVDVSYRVAGTSTWTVIRDVSAAGYELTGLANNTTYEWRVNGACAGGVPSDYSTVRVFTTSCAPVTTSLSAQLTNENDLRLSWVGLEDWRYEVQWRVSGTSGWSVATGLTQANYVISSPLASVIYEWRVRHVCSPSEISEFSPIQTYSVPCYAPFTQFNTEALSGSSVRLTWQNKVPTTTAELQWRTSDAYSWTTVSGITSSPYTLTGLTPGQSYYWQLRRVCEAGVRSDFSSQSYFSLNCFQPYQYQTQEVTNNSATLSWNGGATELRLGYEIQYRTLSGPATWTTITGITTTTYSLSGLTAGQIYEWKVRSTCKANDSAPFGTAQTFVTQCNGALNNLQVTFYKPGGGVALSWYGQSNSGQYEIQYRPAGNGNWISKTVPADEAEPASPAPPGNKTFTLYGLLTDTTYEWRIRGVCGNESVGLWVDGPAFVISCLAPTVYNGSQIDNSRFQVSWYSRTSTDSYRLRWRAVGSTDWLSDVTGQPNYSIPDLKPGTTYEYQLQSVCSTTVNSAFSSSYPFQLTFGSPEIGYPQVTSASSVDVLWQHPKATIEETRSTAFTIQYRLTDGGSWSTVSVPAGQAMIEWPQLKWSVGGLQYSKNYEFQVRAERDGMRSSYSYSTYATLSCQSPYSLERTVLDGTSVQIGWYGGAQAIVQWRIATTTTWMSITASTGSQSPGYNKYTLAGLVPNQAYEWRIASVCWGNTNSDFVTGSSFRTDLPANGCTLMKPAYITTAPGSTSATIFWGFSESTPFSGSAIVQYRVQNMVNWSDWPAQRNSTAFLTGLAPNTTYEVRIRTYCETDGAWQVSTAATFRTICRPLTNVYASANYRTASIRWESGEVAVVQWRLSGSTTWSAVAASSSPVTLTGLTSGATYEYRTQVTCDGNVRSVFSSINTFQTGVDQGYIYVIGGITPTEARLAIIYGGSSAYRVQWREAGAAEWSNTGLLTTQSLLLQNLTPGTEYVARLVLVNGDGALTYSATTTFTTLVPTVTDLYAYNVKPTSAQLNWVSSSADVMLQWRMAGNVGWNTALVQTGAVNSLTGLQAGTPYEWRVAPMFDGVPQRYSSIVTFITICPVVYQVNAERTSPTAALLKWTWQTESSQYILRYRVVGTQPWIERRITGTSVYTLTDLTAATTYEAAVAADCLNNGLPSFTPAVRFTTQCAAATNLWSMGMLNPNRAQLSWTGGSVVSVVRWRPINTTVWTSTLVEGQSALIQNLTAGITYQWQVRSSCAPDVEASYKSGSDFVLTCTSPSVYNQTATPTDPTTVLLRWQASPIDLYQQLNLYGLRWREKGTSIWQSITGISSPYSLTGLATNRTYEWQVGATCGQYYQTDAYIFQLFCSFPTRPQTEVVSPTSVRLRWQDNFGNGPYELQWRLAGTNAWNTVAGVMGTSYTLTGLATGGSYEWQIRSQCTDLPYSQTTLIRLKRPALLGLYTVKNGTWSDPTTWSCNCVPGVTDAVLLRHVVTLPANSSGVAKQVQYEATGQLRIGSGAGLQAVIRP
ncbi:Titin [Fibrella aestuarina BUZ 2]|uniref:Titin n=1 Tax=Fibrella aestuarina BUZ 2 TaxID=1166018 RepID=I0KFA6_9BACT|nr:fibronectin type III domain-containing protein [Fibrella aestuarina]CCH02809.1 Titin [Fibrella aestuarina BUZ 2]